MQDIGTQMHLRPEGTQKADKYCFRHSVWNPMVPTKSPIEPSVVLVILPIAHGARTCPLVILQGTLARLDPPPTKSQPMTIALTKPNMS